MVAQRQPAATVSAATKRSTRPPGAGEAARSSRSRTPLPRSCCTPGRQEGSHPGRSERPERLRAHRGRGPCRHRAPRPLPCPPALRARTAARARLQPRPCLTRGRPSLPLPETRRPRPHRAAAHASRAPRGPRQLRPASARPSPSLPRCAGSERQDQAPRRGPRPARARVRGASSRKRCRLTQPAFRPRPRSGLPHESRAAATHWGKRRFRSSARRSRIAPTGRPEIHPMGRPARAHLRCAAAAVSRLWRRDEDPRVGLRRARFARF